MIPSRKSRYIALAAVLVAVAIGLRFRGRDDPGFVLEKVTRGDVEVVVTASGVLEPEEVVDVGAQVVGQIASFGTDVDGRQVDFGSTVAAGTVLARIDDALFSADVALAEARAERAAAEVDQAAARLVLAERDWERARKLGESEALARTAYDGYRATYLAAKSALAVAKAAVKEADTNLVRAQRNLNFCTIRSPVDGVVIDRRVNTGQTVVSSLNAPSLFLIAKDLSRMQVWTSVNEADIGLVRPGTKAVFTVDAYPGRTFEGAAGKVRLNASMNQNVVTYTVEVDTENRERLLLPYMTANVRFSADSRRGVLKIPAAALSWRPGEGLAVAPDDASRELTEGDPDGRFVWTFDGKALRAVRVETGQTDGTAVEARGEGLREGMDLVTGVRTEEETSGGSSPFVPRMRGGSRR